MSLGKALVLGGGLVAATMALDYAGDKKLNLFGLLDEASAAVADVVHNPEFQTHQGQTKIYFKNNGPGAADDQWCLDHVEIEGEVIPFNLSNGDSLQVESNNGANQVFRVGVKYKDKRFYALVTVPDKDLYNTPAGAYTESTTFYEQVENTVTQNSGTDTININGRTVRLP